MKTSVYSSKRTSQALLLANVAFVKCCLKQALQPYGVAPDRLACRFVRCGQAFALHHLIDAVELDDVVQSMQLRGHVCAEEGSSAKCAHGLNRRAVEPEFHPIYALMCQ
jgi:hypothetical protein